MRKKNREKCFMWNRDKCGAVEDGVVCRNCPFYKTRKEQAASLAKAHERLRGLPMKTQVYYAELYYGGEMPWAPECE